MHGVGVLDEAGKLISNISASDLRLIGSEGASLSILFQTSAEFCKTAHGGGLICVSKNATLLEVVQTLNEKRLHRVYVVSDDGTPAAVISQIDVLKAVRKTMK